MFTRLFLKIQSALVPVGYFLFASYAWAIETGLNKTANVAGFNTGTETGISSRIGAIIGIALSLVGVVFLVLIVYGGFMWMTSAGEKTRVEKAIQIIRDATIGLIIVVAGYIITNFILGSLLEATSNATSTPTAPPAS